MPHDMGQLTNCGNPECEWPIFEGDNVWKHDGKLYCHIQCFLAAKVGGQSGTVRMRWTSRVSGVRA